MATILLLDDDAIIRKVVELALGKKYKVLSAGAFDDAVSLLEREDVDGTIVDINLKDENHDGLEFLNLFKEKYPDKPALIESGYRDVATVVKSMKAGADDYLEKPFDEGSLNLKVDKVFSDSKKLRVFKRAFEKSTAVNQIIGNTPSILKAKALVEQAQQMRVLLYGETGVGKTPFAWLSNRVVAGMQGQERPFEQVNCACLSNEQLQDQLFGHRKGAFTGAIADKRGLVELASGGDLFLDEIGDMPIETQAHFLTFLDSMEYYRLGDDKKRRADVRIISATNKNLKKMVEEGKFRRDLYSRIAQIVVVVPPLRERLEDIEPLLAYFVQQFTGNEKPCDREVVEFLQKFRWEEGNVRELRDAIEYACIMSRNSDCIRIDHFSEAYRPFDTASGRQVEAEGGQGQSIDAGDVFECGLEEYLCLLEKRILENKVKVFTGGLGTLAKKLRVSRPTLYRRLKKYDIGTGKFDELN